MKINNSKAVLIESARMITKPSRETANEYADATQIMATEVSRTMESSDELSACFNDVLDSNLQQTMRDNHINHANFIASLLTSFQAEVLVNTVIWVFSAYEAHGFRSKYWNLQLRTWRHVINRHLSIPAIEELMPLYDWLIAHIDDFHSVAMSLRENEE